MLDAEETEFLLKEYYYRSRNARGYSDYFDVSDKELLHELSTRLDGVRRA